MTLEMFLPHSCHDGHVNSMVDWWRFPGGRRDDRGKRTNSWWKVAADVEPLLRFKMADVNGGRPSSIDRWRLNASAQQQLLVTILSFDDYNRPYNYTTSSHVIR